MSFELVFVSFVKSPFAGEAGVGGIIRSRLLLWALGWRFESLVGSWVKCGALSVICLVGFVGSFHMTLAATMNDLGILVGKGLDMV